MFCKYYNDLALRDCVNGRTDRIEAAPTRKTDIRTWHMPLSKSLTLIFVSVWYTSWKNRGYLSPTALSKMPAAIVHDRWKALSQQLLVFKTQEYDKAK